MRNLIRYIVLSVLSVLLTGAVQGQTVTTIAGNAGVTGAADGVGVAATFNVPEGIVIDSNGNLFVADRHNHLIRKITPNGTVTTFAGSGVDGLLDGVGTAAQFNHPNGLAIKNDTLFVGEVFNHRIRKIAPDGTVTTVAGSGPIGQFNGGFADGPANQARFSGPKGIAIKGDTLFIADIGNRRVRMITPDGNVSTLAGDGNAQTLSPADVTVNNDGNIYISEESLFRVSKITLAGTVTTFAGTGVSGNIDGPGNQAAFGSIDGITKDPDGNLYIADRSATTIRKITPNADVSTITDPADFTFPDRIAVGPDGALYVTDPIDHIIKKVSFPAVEVAADTAFGEPGDTLRVALTMTNNAHLSVGGVQVDVTLGDTNAATFIGLEDTTGNAGFSVSANTTGAETRIVVFSNTNATIPADGERLLATLVYVVAQGTALGSAIDLTLNDEEVGNVNGDLLASDTVNGQLQIGLRGDINRDGRVSILDIILAARILVGKDAAPAAGSVEFQIADLNQDNALDVADIIAQVNDILGIVPKAVASSPTQPVNVSLDALRTLSDGRGVLPVTLGTDGLIAGTQLAFSFEPALVEIGAPQPAGAAENLGFDYHIEDGTLRLVVYGLQPGTGIPAGQDAVLYLPVTLLGNAAASPSVTLTEALLVDAQAQTVPVQLGVITQQVSGRNAAVPSAFSLGEATPNPFNPSTVISYDVPQQAQVTLTVYNLLGQEVVRLVDQVQAAGRYQVTWHAVNSQGASVASGVYLYRLTSDTGHSESRRMTLLK